MATLMMLAMTGMFHFSKRPLRFCTSLGLRFASLASSVVLLTLEFISYEWHIRAGLGIAVRVGRIRIRDRSVFLDVVGKYVGLIFDEVKGRPRYLIRVAYGAATALDDEGRSAQQREQVKSDDKTR